MKLSDWVDEYRQFDPAAVERPMAETSDDWLEPDLLAPTDRVRDTTPRWRLRAERVGYARVTNF